MALIQLPGANSGTYTPADVERKRRMAELLMNPSAIDSRTPWDALAEGLNSAHGGYEQSQASYGEQSGMSGASSRLGAILADPQVKLSQLSEAAGDPWNSSSQNSIIEALIGKQIDPNKGGTQPTSDIQNFEYGQSHPGFSDYQTQKGGSAETSLTPTWGVDADGNPVIMQLNKAGVAAQTELPEGISPIDPRQLAGMKAGGTIDGKTQASAQALLPTAELAAQQTLDVIGKLRSDEKGLAETFGNTLGIPNVITPTMPGTAKANYAALLDQAKGKVFLTAYQSLKGGGAITEVEGLKAEQALARLSTAQSKDAYLSALVDFEQAVKDGLEKVKYAASGGQSEIPGAPTQGGGGPKPGAVEDGYRFKGGDPAVSSNWEKVN